MTTFTTLGLSEPLLRALTAEGYTEPTPIQAQAIPSVMAGDDLLGIAQTGTGKTAAFALPILHRLAANRNPAPPKGCRVLVLSPTRELATQIGDSFRTYGKFLGLKVAVVFGGVGYRPQFESMARGVDVLVATPGRLLDHTENRAILLGHTEIFVLDEADQMLDLGFLKPIKQVVAQLPKQRQNLFFSATMPSEIGKLAKELLRDPVQVSVAPHGRTVERVEQKVIHVEHAKKRALLVDLLADKEMSRTLVFTRTKRGADRVAQHLTASGINAAAIHGNKSQGQRERALSEFKADKVNVLVATDIAARGIDIDQVSHVVNFELPDVPESYVHRIGRTARAGASGMAITLCSGDERSLLRDIERLTHQTIPSEDRRGDAALSVDATPLSTRADDVKARDQRGGRGGRGRSAGGGDARQSPRGGDARQALRVARPAAGRSRPAPAMDRAERVESVRITEQRPTELRTAEPRPPRERSPSRPAVAPRARSDSHRTDRSAVPAGGDARPARSARFGAGKPDARRADANRPDANRSEPRRTAPHDRAKPEHASRREPVKNGSRPPRGDASAFKVSTDGRSLPTWARRSSEAV